MADPGSPEGETVDSSTPAVAEAVRLFRSLFGAVADLDVSTLERDDLVELVAGVREGRQALDRLLIRIAMAADRHVVDSKGRGAVGTLLGDGRRVRGRTAHREAERARTVSKLPRFQPAVEAGRLGAPQIDAISAAIKGLSADELLLLDTDDLVDAASSQPADVFAPPTRPTGC